MTGNSDQINSDEIIFENITVSLRFSEFRTLNEGFHNFLPSDIDKKRDHAEEVHAMLSKAYADQGGIKGTGFESPESMVQNIPMWKLHKQDGKIRSVAMYKDSDGRKRVAIATDGTPEGKASAAKVVDADLRKQRAHMEVSGKSLSVLKKMVSIGDFARSYEDAEKFHASRGDKIERPDDNDPEVVRHPELKHFMYSRELGGEKKTKIMLGKQGLKITEATAEDHFKASKSRFNRSHYSTGGWTVVPNTHPAAQAADRRPEFSTDDWNKLHDKSVAAIHKHGVPSGYHVMFSRHMDQGYVTHVDHESKKLNIVTVLPRGKYRPTKEGDGRVIFESISEKFVEVD